MGLSVHDHFVDPLGNPLGLARRGEAGKPPMVIYQESIGTISLPIGYSKLRVTLVGLGGQGGAGTADTNDYLCAGAGGGCGGIAQSSILAVLSKELRFSRSGNVLLVEYGSLSMSATPGVAGGNGVTGSPAGSIGAVGGAGGIGSGGAINLQGASGKPGYRNPATGYSVRGGAGGQSSQALNQCAGIFMTPVTFMSGVGGSGALSQLNNAADGQPGVMGSGGGGGGSGWRNGPGTANTTPSAGGAGGPGFVRIELW